MCGDIHPNPGPTMTNINSTSSGNVGSRKQNTEQKDSSLFCMDMNARSLRKTFLTQENRQISNMFKFQELVYSESIDLMFVTETWFNSNISDREILPIGYDIYRTDRSLGRSGGDVLIAIKQDTFINCNQISSVSMKNLEAVAIECSLPNLTKWLVVCCYRPPDSNDMSDFRSFADKLFPVYDKILIAGDFNLPNISWTDSNYTATGSLNQNFCDVLDDYFMSQLCLVPTRESNILDLLFTNQPEHITLTAVHPPAELGMNSDHNIIHFQISTSSNIVLPNKRLIYDYRQANFDGLRKKLNDMELCTLLTNNGTKCSIDGDWFTWKKAMFSAMNAFIPTKHVDPHRTPPWITSTILHQIQEVYLALQNLDPFKAHGPDGFPSRVLKECAFQLAPSLHYLFTKSLRLSQIPTEWKLANIIPLHKKGVKEQVENYRPISLLSIVSKTLERCVLNHLFLRIQESVHSAQYGFIIGRSSTSQLLSTLHKIGKDLDKRLQTDVVFMDISKAFDTVDHAKLLQKLRDFGLSGSLLLWFENYLSGRCQEVTVHGATSTPFPITSGVPQGSLLAPFLFSVYINDLPDNISISTGVGLYADDTKLHRCVQNRNDALALQSDIQSLHCWSNENLLSFNKSKCKVLSITRRTSPLIYPYALGDHQLLSSDVESDLGITISSRLLWNVQINKVRSKANKTLGLIRRSTMEITDMNTRRFLYLQLVRSNFSYATQAWCPQSVKLIEDVEKELQEVNQTQT
ncbi:Hypothetical predicted protein [Paramuricea clavata]|uniref:Uncharacterized protein n=1 Tax=Paramuricea clavata TaxID=317549 RepID=A0A6S7G9Y5_PARCT|nr:Hypothetical predicted protein [Paramuricea clavata]